MLRGGSSEGIGSNKYMNMYAQENGFSVIQGVSVTTGLLPDNGVESLDFQEDWLSLLLFGLHRQVYTIAICTNTTNMNA